MAVPAEPALLATARSAAASSSDRSPAGPAIVSRFGEISPAFAAAFGASVDVALLLGSRNAEARAFSSPSHHAQRSSRRPALPVEIPTVRAVPASRVRTAVVTGSSR